MIHIILVRHGERVRGTDNSKSPLTQSGREAAEALGRRLSKLCKAPTCIMTSTYKHAEETAESIVRGWDLKTPPSIQSISALTPKSQYDALTHWADEHLDDALIKVCDKIIDPVVLLVGHETRLSQLILHFTGERTRQLDALEAACIRAENWQVLWLGQGRVEWRYPVRNWLEGELAGKITSKMTVATFLASANFIGLMELLLDSRDLLAPSQDLSASWEAKCQASIPGVFCGYLFPFEIGVPSFLLVWAALIAHFFAAALFVAAIYCYDRLTMPPGFWVLKRPWWSKKDGEEAQEKLLLNGYLQAHMVRVWSVIFTPAVFLSASGVLLLVASTGAGLLLAILILISAAVVSFYIWNRPTGDVD